MEKEHGFWNEMSLLKFFKCHISMPLTNSHSPSLYWGGDKYIRDGNLKNLDTSDPNYQYGLIPQEVNETICFFLYLRTPTL